MTHPAPGDAEIVARRAVSFVLPFALTSLNVRQRQHWAELTRERKRLIQECMAAIGGPRHFPRPPFARARVTVVRSSAGQLDPDNLVATCKPLLDALCVASPTHPGSLGIIEDDNARQCELKVSSGPAARGDGFTAVRVEELPALPPEQVLATKKRKSAKSRPFPAKRPSRRALRALRVGMARMGL